MLPGKNTRAKLKAKDSTDCRMNVSCHEEFASGTFLQLSAAAFMIKSFTDSFTFSFFSNSFKSLRNLHKSTSTTCLKLKPLFL